MAVTLINVFKVPEEHEDTFLRNWNETTGVYARTEGFIDTRMHRNTGVGSPTFTFINVATWASNEAFIQAHKDYVPGEESIPGIEFDPAIYEEIIAIKNLLSGRSEVRIPMHSAHPYRFQTAHRSNLKSPTVPISNRPPF